MSEECEFSSLPHTCSLIWCRVHRQAGPFCAYDKLKAENDRLRKLAKELDKWLFTNPEVMDEADDERISVLHEQVRQLYSSTSAGKGGGGSRTTAAVVTVGTSAPGDSVSTPNPKTETEGTTRCFLCEHAIHDEPCNYLTNNGCKCEGRLANKSRREQAKDVPECRHGYIREHWMEVSSSGETEMVLCPGPVKEVQS